MGRTTDAKNSLKASLRLGLLLALAMVSAVGCTKKKEVRFVGDAAAYNTKADFEGKTFYFVRGVEEADGRNPFGAVPGMYLEGGVSQSLVRARVTEKALVFETAYDSMGQAETPSIVASYPIADHFDIKREQNDFKEQTNKISENHEKPWNQRQFMRVDWANPNNSWGKITSFVGEGAEVSEENPTLLEIAAPAKDGTITWLTETSLKGKKSVRWIAWHDFDAEPAYKVVYRTYLMPVKDTTGFKPVTYTDKDFARFGYFTTQLNALDPLKGLRDSGIKVYANVFDVCEAGRTEDGKPAACSTNKIVWHLNKGFPDKYLDSARMAVAAWNQSFKEALNRVDDVVVLNETERPERVDARVNLIAHYGPDSVTGPCGVAQGVRDPLTGLTVSARANVYEQCNRDMLAEVDDLIDAVNGDADLEKILKTGSSTSQNIAVANTIIKGIVSSGAMLKQVKPSRLALKFPQTPAAVAANFVEKMSYERSDSVHRQANLLKSQPDLFAFNAFRAVGGILPAQLTSLADFEKVSKSPSLGFENLLEYGNQVRRAKELAQQGAKLSVGLSEAIGVHGAELVDEAVQNYLMSLVKAKSPKELDAKREEIKAEVDKRVFFMILTHEMGHCFGLRHNFKATADKEHFHPKYAEIEKEVAAGKATPEDLAPYEYSSVMDYVADFHAWYGGTSQYDTAAIRYGYNRSINRDEDASTTKKNFLFCSDYQVGEDLLCNRFDKGTNLSEITQNRIDSYERNFIRTHFRRDRARFDRAAGSAAGRAFATFIELRKVMDEFMFQLNDPKAERASADELKATGCGIKFLAESIGAGEIANICRPVEAERGLVDIFDYGTLGRGLIDVERAKNKIAAMQAQANGEAKAESKGEAPAPVGKDPGIFRKHYSEYKQMKLADLVYANEIAKSFFRRLLSTMEPGLYFVEPPAEKGQAPELKALPEAPTLEERIRLFAAREGIESAEDMAVFLKEAPKFLVTIQVGPDAKPYSSQYETQGETTRLQRIGAGIDKIVAIEALGLRDLGVSKYDQINMNANAYLYPHTRTFTKELFSDLVTGNNFMGEIIVTLPDGQKVSVPKPSSLGIDTQSVSTIVALTDFVFNVDHSAIDMLRVCSANDQQCLNSLGNETVEFRTASGSDKFRAAQTVDGDSIAFKLVAEAKELDTERQKWLDIKAKEADRHADALMKMNNLVESRERLDAALASIPELKVVRESLTGEQSAWDLMQILTEKLNDIGFFQAQDYKETIRAIIQGSIGQIKAQMTALGEKGKCPAPGVGKEKELQECEKSADAIRRKALNGIAKELGESIKVLSEVLNGNMQAKEAPYRIKFISEEIKAKEANMRLIRKIMKLTAED